MPVYTDQMNRKVVLDKAPERIISLVPSQSELLWDLGLKNRLAGITKFCIHPEEMFRSIPRIGGTKKIHIEKVHALRPDLIIGNKEENTKEQIEELEKHYPVWMSDIKTLEEALYMIRKIGIVCGKETEASGIASRISGQFAQLRVKPGAEHTRVLYLIWNKPIMCASAGTFIGHMLSTCGFKPVIPSTGNPYPVLSVHEVKNNAPQVILLSSEPYPFREKHIQFFKEICPAARVLLVDGEMFSWYGSRLLHAPAYFIKLMKTINDAVSE